MHPMRSNLTIKLLFDLTPLPPLQIGEGEKTVILRGKVHSPFGRGDLGVRLIS
mgnify:CR=1 FL=1